MEDMAHGRLRARVKVPRAFYVQCAYRQPARGAGFVAGLKRNSVAR